MDELVATYVFFVKTSNNFHQGGHVFFSPEEFDEAKSFLPQEVDHLVRSEQAKDPDVEFESWGLVNSLTGEIVEQFDSYSVHVS